MAVVTVGGVFAVLLAVGIVGSIIDPVVPAVPEASSEVAPAALTDLSLAGRLAVIHNDRGPVMPSAALIGEFERVLADMEAKCSETASEIADMAVFTQRELADAGREDTLLDVLRAATGAIPGELAGVVQCREIFAAFLL